MGTYRLLMHGMAVEATLPARWKVNYLPAPDLPALDEAGLHAAFANPVGTPRLAELARGRRKAIVIVEDQTRPCPIPALARLIVAELLEGGIARENVKFIMAVGGHKPMAGKEFRAKLGDEVVENFEVINPNPYENMVEVGVTPSGIPVEVDMAVAEADLKISISALLPHNVAGYTGGGKLILPGVCSMRTIVAHHLDKRIQAGQGGFGQVDCLFREELEAAARLVGLDFVVEALLNPQLEIAALWVGDMVEAHRAGARAAREVHTVSGPTGVDVGIITGFPRDIELLQGMAAFAPHTGAHSVKPDGALLFLAAAPEGVGYHTLLDRGRKDATPRQPLTEHTLLYSPNLAPWQAKAGAPAGTVLYRRLEDALQALVELFPVAEANVFPHGAMTIFKPLD